MKRPALVLRGVVKTYGAVRALDDVGLEVIAGEIHALCGENGAGKSTLAHVAAGMLDATSGEIACVGTIGLVRQHFELAERLRVWENVVLGREPQRGARLDARAARARVRDLATRTGLFVDPDAIVETLSIGLAQRVEILRELDSEPSVLVLDEPTAILAPREAETLFASLRALARAGTAILVITHKLADVLAHADRVTVLRAGRVTLRAIVAQTTADTIARAMVGGDLPTLPERESATVRDRLTARAIGTTGGRLHNVSFTIGAGEIVGVAGVEGNGQSELVDVLAGVRAHTGTLALGGDELRPGDPHARIARGIRTIAGDRQREGLVMAWSVAENAALGDQSRVEMRRGPLVDRAARARRAREIVAEFDVRTPSIATPVAALSGGNQQKIVVGRAFGFAPQLIVAYAPTRGIDIGAAALVHARLLEARNAGVGIVLVSFDLDELFTLADRLLVLCGGTFVHACTRVDFDRARIGAFMAGASP